MMQARTRYVFVAVAAGLAVSCYDVEPWAVAFVDDGPYLSTEYSGPTALPRTPNVHSELPVAAAGDANQASDARAKRRITIG